MDRRAFLTAIPISFVANVSRTHGKTPIVEPLIPSDIASWKLDDSFKAQDYFEPVLFHDGMRIEFPLDIISSKKITHFAVAENVCKNQLVQSFNEVAFVNTFDMSVSGQTQEELIDKFQKKLNITAASLLFFAGNHLSPLLIEDSEEKLLKEMGKSLRSNNRLSHTKLSTFKFGNYIIGVNNKSDSFVMPVRVRPEAFFDRLDNTGYMWADLGMAVLNTKDILIGYVKG